MDANFQVKSFLGGHHRYHIMANTPHGGILKVSLRLIDLSAALKRYHSTKGSLSPR